MEKRGAKRRSGGISVFLVPKGEFGDWLVPLSIVDGL